MDKNLIWELKEQTGNGMFDCKKALEETGGDLTKAAAWLQERNRPSLVRLDTNRKMTSC